MAEKRKDPDATTRGHSELERLRAFDRQQHIQRSLEAGLSREQAEAHADEDLREREEGRE